MYLCFWLLHSLAAIFTNKTHHQTKQTGFALCFLLKKFFCKTHTRFHQNYKKYQLLIIMHIWNISGQITLNIKIVISIFFSLDLNLWNKVNTQKIENTIKVISQQHERNNKKSVGRLKKKDPPRQKTPGKPAMPVTGHCRDGPNWASSKRSACLAILASISTNNQTPRTSSPGMLPRKRMLSQRLDDEYATQNT